MTQWSSETPVTHDTTGGPLLYLCPEGSDPSLRVSPGG